MNTLLLKIAGKRIDRLSKAIWDPPVGMDSYERTHQRKGLTAGSLGGGLASGLAAYASNHKNNNEKHSVGYAAGLGAAIGSIVGKTKADYDIIKSRESEKDKKKLREEEDIKRSRQPKTLIGIFNPD